MILAQFMHFFVKGWTLLGGYKWQSDKLTPFIFFSNSSFFAKGLALDLESLCIVFDSRRRNLT